MPLIVISTRFFSKKMHRRYQTVQAAFSDLTEVIRERFAGIRIIKAHHLYKEEADRVEAASKSYVDKNIKLVKIIGSFFPMMVLFSNLSLAIVLYLGGRKTIMEDIHRRCLNAAESFGTPGNYVDGANIAGFIKVADAMMDQGVI